MADTAEATVVKATAEARPKEAPIKETLIKETLIKETLIKEIPMMMDIRMTATRTAIPMITAIQAVKTTTMMR